MAAAWAWSAYGTAAVQRSVEPGLGRLAGTACRGGHLAIGRFHRAVAHGQCGGQQRYAQALAHLVLDLVRQLRVLAQEFACGVAALADFFAVVGIPGATLFDDARG